MTNIIALPTIKLAHPPPDDPLRIVAREAFLRFRPQNKTPDGTLKMLVQEIRRAPAEWPPDLLPPDDIQTLRLWSRDDDWEAQYRTRQVQETLNSPELQPHHRLAQMLKQRKSFEMALTHARDRIELPDASPLDFKTHDRLWSQVRELDTEVDRLEELVRRREYERTGAHQSLWTRRTDEIFQELQQQYVGYGQVYLILCRSAAEVRTRIEMMNDSGRDVPASEFDKLYHLQTATIAQLQKYTETMKSSVVGEEVQTAIRKLLSIIESEVGTENPYIMERIVRAVRQRLEGADSASEAPRARLSGAE